MAKRPFDPKAEETHHILWPAKAWDNAGFYTKRLRRHPYMKKMIPRDTLHRYLHSMVAQIPLPSQTNCWLACIRIDEAIEAGRIDLEYDTVEQRIDFLLDVWSFDTNPYTVLCLHWQKNVIHQFYTPRFCI